MYNETRGLVNMAVMPKDIMNNSERKKLIMDKLNDENIEHIYDAIRVLGGEIEALEAVPFGRRNEVIRIAEDFTDCVIDGPTSLERLKEFVINVPD